MSKSNFDPIKALGIFIFVFLFFSWIISFFFHESNSYFFDFPFWRGNPRTLVMHDAMFLCTVSCILIVNVYIYIKHKVLIAVLKKTGLDKRNKLLKGITFLWCMSLLGLDVLRKPFIWNGEDIHNKTYSLINFDFTLFILMYACVGMFLSTYVVTILTLGVIRYGNKSNR